MTLTLQNFVKILIKIYPHIHVIVFSILQKLRCKLCQQTLTQQQNSVMTKLKAKFCPTSKRENTMLTLVYFRRRNSGKSWYFHVIFPIFGSNFRNLQCQKYNIKHNEKMHVGTNSHIS